jgi:hypothetical protein
VQRFSLGRLHQQELRRLGLGVYVLAVRKDYVLRDGHAGVGMRMVGSVSLQLIAQQQA